MKNRKKIIFFLVIVVLLLTLISCLKKEADSLPSSSSETSKESKTDEEIAEEEKQRLKEEIEAKKKEQEESELEKLKEETERILNRNKENSIIYIKEGTDGTDDGFKTLTKTMEKEGEPFYKTSEEDGVVGINDVILLKVNCQWDQRGGTNVDLVKSVVEAIFDHPEGFDGEVVIVDNGQAQWGSSNVGGSFSWEYPNSKDRKTNIQMVIDEFKGEGFKISGYLFDSITKTQVKEFDENDSNEGFVVLDAINGIGVPISYPKFITEYKTKISFKKGIWEDEKYNLEKFKIINMPVLKAHVTYQVTGAVKNYMGTTSEILVGQKTHYAVGKGAMGPQMTETKMPDLNILDAIHVTPEGGPSSRYEYASEVRMILASKDPVALDSYAAKYILIEEAKKAGHTSVESLDPDGTTPGTFGYWLDLSLKYMNEGGYNFTKDLDKILAYNENGLY